MNPCLKALNIVNLTFQSLDKKDLPTKAEIYWDNQCEPEGWAYRVTLQNDSQKSGEWEGNTPRFADATELEEAVRDLMFENGVVVSTDEVSADPYTDGGFAFWEKQLSEN